MSEGSQALVTAAPEESVTPQAPISSYTHPRGAWGKWFAGGALAVHLGYTTE